MGYNTNMGKNFKGDNFAILLTLCFIPLLALDKLYKESVLCFLLKLFSAITIVIAVVWWILDIVMCFLGKYEVNPIRYFKKAPQTEQSQPLKESAAENNDTKA